MSERPHLDYTTVVKTDNQSSAQTDKVIWTPASGKRIVLLQIVISTNAANNVEVESSDVDVLPPMYLAANGGVVDHFGGRPIWVGAADATLTYTSSAGTNLSVKLVGYEDKF